MSDLQKILHLCPCVGDWFYYDLDAPKKMQAQRIAACPHGTTEAEFDWSVPALVGVADRRAFKCAAMI